MRMLLGIPTRLTGQPASSITFCNYVRTDPLWPLIQRQGKCGVCAVEAQSLIRGDLRRNVSRQPRRKTDGRRAQPPSLRSYGEPRESAAVVVGEAQPPGLHSSHAPCSATRSTAHFQLSFFGNASNSSCFRSTCLRASIIQRSVIPLCECPLQPFHTRHQVGLRRLQQEVIVIPHQHIGMNPEPRPPAHLGQRIQKSGRIASVAKDRLSPIPTTHHMINGPRVVNAYAPWHSHTNGRANPPRQSLSATMCGPTPYPPNRDTTEPSPSSSAIGLRKS